MDVLDRFGTTNDIFEIDAAVTALIKSKKTLHQALDDERYKSGLSVLATKANAKTCSADRLKAVAILGRLRASLRTKGDAVADILRNTLDEPLDSAQFLNNGDDRYYVAAALQVGTGGWLADYCAREVIAEPTAENSRVAFAELLLSRTATIEDAFEALSAYWTAFEKPQKDRSNAVCKRLRRVFAALANALKTVRISERGLFGEAAKRLITGALREEKEPDDLAILRQLANEVAKVIDELVRRRLSLLLDSSIYAPIQTCRRWFPLSSWPSFVTRSRDFAHLVETISQAILLSAKQNTLDQRLLEALELCTGQRAAGVRVTGALAAATPSLSPESQIWLKTWRVPDVGQLRRPDIFSADEYIASALIEAWNVERQLDNGRHADTDALRHFIAVVRRLASARGIALTERCGEEVEYIPAAHALVGDLKTTRRVRIVRPGVERLSTAGIRSMLIKAMAESVLTSDT